MVVVGGGSGGGAGGHPKSSRSMGAPRWETLMFLTLRATPPLTALCVLPPARPRPGCCLQSSSAAACCCVLRCPACRDKISVRNSVRFRRRKQMICLGKRLASPVLLGVVGGRQSRTGRFGSSGYHGGLFDALAVDSLDALVKYEDQTTRPPDRPHHPQNILGKC